MAKPLKQRRLNEPILRDSSERAKPAVVLYPTLAAAIDYAKSKNYPSAIVEYKGETSVEYKTEFSEQPGDPMEVKR